jgi:large subunit ribosomal protein L17
MRRNLASSLFEHETISTTIEKAKEVKPFAEKLITLAKKGTLAARRRAIELLNDREIVKDEEGEPVKSGTVIRKLFSEIGPRYLDRPGGYTRIIRLAQTRLGDNGQLCLLQLVTTEKQEEKQPKKKSKGSKKSKAKKEKAAIGAEKSQAAQKSNIVSESEDVESGKENSGADATDRTQSKKSKKSTRG